MLTRYREDIEQAARAHGLDPDIVEAVVLTESGGKTHAYRYEPGFWRRYLQGKPEWDGRNPERVSASYGLMQVMFPTAKEHGFLYADPELLFVPSIGLDIGCRVLKALIAWSHGEVFQALAAYNGGKGNNQAPPFKNAGYAEKVLTHLSAVRKNRKV